MADKNEKVEAAPADPRDALLAKLQSQVADLAKAKKAAETAAADAADYAKELEAELKDAAKDVGALPGDKSLLAVLVEGQAQLAKAMGQLLETKNGPKELTHADTLVDGKVQLDPKHKGTRYYRRTRPQYSKGSYFEAGLTFVNGVVGNLKILTDAAPSRTDVEVTSTGADLVPTAAATEEIAVVPSASGPSKTEV